MDGIGKTPVEKKGSISDRPLFLQNGNGRTSSSESKEIGEFRRALPQFLAVSGKNILLFVYGMTLGFPTVVIPAIQGGEGREPSDIVLNREEISWFSSINLICVPLGCLFSGLLSQPIGKRRAMQFVNLPILASWLLFHFATKTEHLYAALCLSGLGGGLMEAPVLTYVAEITEPKYRGVLSALGSTCVITGVFIQFIMGSLMDWRTIAAVSSAFPVISIIALCFVPESPTWLIREHRFREAVKALQWLRGWVPEYKIEAEFNRLYEELITAPALEEARETGGEKPSKCASRVRMFRKRSFLVPFLLVAYTFFTGHFSGKTPLQTYAVQIFHTLKAPINKYHATILLGAAEIIATVLGMLLIHFTGKRPLVLVSISGVAICFFGTATYAHYLKIVPGFAVNNVVVNASSIVPKDSIISQDNITTIFQNEEKVLLQALDPLIVNLDKLGVTTPFDLPDTMLLATTMQSTLSDERSSAKKVLNRAIREHPYKTLDNSSDYNNNATFLGSLELDYVGSNDTKNSSIASIDFEHFDSEEDDMVTTTVMPNTTMETTTSTTVSPTTNQHSVKKVVNELLLPVPKQQKNDLVWLPLALLLGAAFFAHLGIRMIPWILIGEVFPAPVRSTASGLVSGLGYIFGFLANKLFLQMLSALTLPGTFWFYSFVACTGTIVLYFVLPETEGYTLAEIEAHFSKKSEANLLSKTWRKNHKATTIQLDNLQDLRIPIGPNAQAKILEMQQSGSGPGLRLAGVVNPAFDSSNTTHL